MRSVLMAVSLLLVGGCAILPDYKQPKVELPETWGAAQPQQAAPSTRWWTLYQDERLNRLIDEALVNNANIALAIARVDEARARAGVVDAALLPTVDAGFKRSRQQSSERSSAPMPPGMARERNDYTAQVNISYELDLWGRYRNASAAARAELLASEAASEIVRITLAADVAKSYFALRAYDEQISATRRALGTRNEWLSLQAKRLELGAISEFDYRQLEADLAAARAQLPALENERGRQENALAVLLGRSPKAIYEGQVDRASSLTTVLEVAVPAGLPSTLLLRRPDLVEAEQKLVAANARIASTRAAVFPSISLTGYLGSESAVLRNLFSGPAGIWFLAASIAQPIFSGGRNDAEIDAARAREAQALAQYRSAIQNAFREVRDALYGQTKMRERTEAEQQRITALQQALRLALLRYENGVASQLDVLDAERNLLIAEQSAADARRAQRAALADLFKALGGGWDAETGELKQP